MQRPTRRVTSADGTSLAVYEYGEPTAPVLVCVHGYSDNAALWEPVATKLADDFRVITYDVRGAEPFRASGQGRTLDAPE
jgi:pimeloyl-ACP methyl ester carboxylesterase